MEIRRAILLFAIVLGLAAIVSSIARTSDPVGDDAPPTDVARDGARTGTGTSAAGPIAEAAEPVTLEFRSGARPRTHRVELGQPATVLVDVETPGQVEIPSLGLTGVAEPLTPAMFEVLETAPGSHPILAEPVASGAPPVRIGTLEVVPAP